MGTFTIEAPNGKSYTIEGENAQGALAALKKHLGQADQAAPAPDKYQQAALDERAAVNPGDAGLTRRLAHGATLGADSTILAGLETPLEMIKQGTFNPAEGYRYAKAREDLIMDKARQNTGMLGTGAEVLGGGVAGAGLANAGITAGRFLGQNAGTLARLGASTADAAGLGAVAGANEGDGLQERAANAIKGGAAGLIAGPAAVLGGKLLGAVGAPIFANIKARMNPAGYAEGQVSRAIHESGVTPDDLSLRAIQAANEGQPQFNLADAMGNPGQRMLSTVARAPGEGRTAVVEALEQRQAGQGRRVTNALAEGFDAPQTAAQTRNAMTTARDTAADAEYGAVRNNGGQVDVVPAINNIDRNIGTGPGQQMQVPNDSIEGVLRPYRERLSRVNPDDFEAVQRIRSDMADAAQSARQTDMMQRRIGREMTMFETRNQALGGSRTADMISTITPQWASIRMSVGQILTGNWHGAVRSVLSAGHNAMTGNTPQVRREVANILLQNGGNISAHELRDMVNRTVARIQFVQSIARNVGRGAAGGLAVAVPSVSAGANRGGR
jgi:hypothetical protein